MGEMDIYMRRRLVALGGLVAFFIIFVLLVKSCGDEEEAPVTPVATTDEVGTALLTRDEYIAQADAICAEANASVAALDPEDPQATADEFEITSGEFAQLRQLQPEETDAALQRFLAALKGVVAALESKSVALDRGDVVGAEEAQVEIDLAEIEARELGDRYGFFDCGQFLDAGQAPGGAGGATTDPTVDPGAGGVVAPPASTTTTPVTPEPTTTTPVTPAPTPDDSGGITP